MAIIMTHAPSWILLWQLPEVSSPPPRGLILLRNLTPLQRPVCHNSSGLYSVQDRRGSKILMRNGCEAAGRRGCARGGDARASISGYESFSGLLCFMDRFCLDS